MLKYIKIKVKKYWRSHGPPSFLKKDRWCQRILILWLICLLLRISLPLSTVCSLQHLDPPHCNSGVIPFFYA